MIFHSNNTSAGKQVQPAIPQNYGRSAFLWSLFAVLGAVMVINPQLIISEAWASTITATADRRRGKRQIYSHRKGACVCWI